MSFFPKKPIVNDVVISQMQFIHYTAISPPVRKTQDENRQVDDLRRGFLVVQTTRKNACGMLHSCGDSTDSNVGN